MESLRDREIARRVEHAQAWGTARAVRDLARTLGDPAYDAEPILDGWCLYAPPAVPLWGVRGVGFDAALGGDAIAQVEAAFDARGLPASVDLCPLADTSLDARLADRGYEAALSCEVWVRSLAEGVPAADPAPGVAVTAVDAGSADAVERFADTVARGYRDGGEPDAWNVAIGRNAARRPDRQAFLAEVGGRLAGGGMLGVTDGLATFTFMSTLPQARRRGVQGALMRARLAAARERGADVACVQCMPGSPTARNAERLGFRRLYVRTVRTRTRRRS